MSRLIKKPIVIPKGVDVKIVEGVVSTTGPKGSLNCNFHGLMDVSLENGNEIFVREKDRGNIALLNVEQKFLKKIIGTTWSNVRNAVVGVASGFERKLNLVGVGYRAQKQGNTLVFSLGYSHPVNYEIPDGIDVQLPTQTEIIVSGANKQLVGQVAAKIRSYRPVEVYKGKGVRYSNEVVILKETKKK